MNTYKKLSIALLCVFFISPISSRIKTKRTELDNFQDSLQEKRAHINPTIVEPQDPEDSEKNQSKIFSFKYADESLIDIINQLAQEKGVNVLLPPKAEEITTKVTISIPEKLSLDQAWQLLILISDIAGYSLEPKPDNNYAIVKTSPQVYSDPLPLYIGVPYDQLPNTDQHIRAMFFLSNIKVPTPDQAASTEQNTLNTVLKELLPNGQGSKSKVMFDTVTNALIITERANNIRSVMEIVNMLDKTGFKEKVEIVPLFHAVASEVKRIFDQIIPPDNKDLNPYRLDARKPTNIDYFSKFMRIIPNDRLNNLIIIGREQAVDRVKEFILSYIDVPQESGKSVLHTYSLQYLEAKDFAGILTSIVQGTDVGGTGQSTSGLNTAGGGVERYFEGVKIWYDMPDEATPAQASAVGGEVKIGTITEVKPLFYGGNKLIIAARHSDWVRIKKLIQELDTPQPQVILEILVADLTINDQRLLGSIFRNPMCLPLAKDVQFQSAQIGRVLVNSLGPTVGAKDFPPMVTVATSPCGSPDCVDNNCNVDLLKNAFNDENKYSGLGEVGLTKSIAANESSGSAFIAFSDPDCKVWGMTELKDFLTNTKILSNPHLIAVNNTEASIRIGQVRLVQDSVVGNQAATATISYKALPADLAIKIQPRINVVHDEDPSHDTVHLGILVEITQFTSTDFILSSPDINSDDPEKANRFQRIFSTSALVRSGAIIPLGGLASRDTLASVNQTPLLGKIPFLGWFFKNRTGQMIDSNLTVFICPTVIRPRLRRGGMDAYTRDYVKLTKRYGQETGLFDSLKDPITRWFFKTDSDVVDVLTDFLSEDEMKQQPEFRVPTERSKKQKIGQQALKADLQEIQKDDNKQISTLSPDKDARLKTMVKNVENPLATKKQLAAAAA